MTVTATAAPPEVPRYAVELARRRTRDMVRRFLNRQTFSGDDLRTAAPTLTDLVTAAYILGLNDSAEAQS